jgi:hypothetical protein
MGTRVEVAVDGGEVGVLARAASGTVAVKVGGSAVGKLTRVGGTLACAVGICGAAVGEVEEPACEQATPPATSTNSAPARTTSLDLLMIVFVYLAA